MSTTKNLVAWEEADVDVDKVISAIELWHVDNDLPCPPDAQFATIVVLTRVGESTSERPDMELAEQCRAVMPCGNVYSIAIEHDADFDGERYVAEMSFSVKSAEVVR